MTFLVSCTRQSPIGVHSIIAEGGSKEDSRSQEIPQLIYTYPQYSLNPNPSTKYADALSNEPQTLLVLYGYISDHFKTIVNKYILEKLDQ